MLTCSSPTILPRSSSLRSKCCSMATPPSTGSNPTPLIHPRDTPSSPRRVVTRQEALGETDEEADAGRDGAVVESVFGVVQVAAAGAVAVAEPQHGAGTRVEQIGEILAAERRADVAVDRPLAADLGGNVGGEGGLLGIVHRRRIIALVVDRRGGAERRRGAAHDLAEPALDEVAHLGPEGARGAADDELVGNDVVGAADLHEADGDAGVVDRVHVAADD